MRWPRHLNDVLCQAFYCYVVCKYRDLNIDIAAASAGGPYPDSFYDTSLPSIQSIGSSAFTQQNKSTLMGAFTFLAAELGFEPRQYESES